MSEKFGSLLLFFLILVVGVFLGSMIDGWGVVEEDPSSTTTPIQNLPHSDLGRVRVEVLNGGGVSGMASTATDHLRELGFDVVYYGNAPTFGHNSTVVLDRSGRPNLAEAVADALGSKVGEDDMEKDPYLDVTVILGKNWGINKQEKSVIKDVTQLPWWNVRKYLR